MFTEQDHKELDDARESDKMRAFCRWAIRRSAFDGCDLDGAAVQEKAIALGLIVPVVATKSMADSCLYGECEEGDTVYEFAGPIKT